MVSGRETYLNWFLHLRRRGPEPSHCQWSNNPPLKKRPNMVILMPNTQVLRFHLLLSGCCSTLVLIYISRRISSPRTSLKLFFLLHLPHKLLVKVILLGFGKPLNWPVV